MGSVVRKFGDLGLGGRRCSDRVSSGWTVVVRGRVLGVGVGLDGLAGDGGRGLGRGKGVWMDEMGGRGL